MYAPTDLQPLTLGLLDAALARLRGETEEAPELVVHELRKGIKALRAALRVASPSLGPKATRKQDRRLRDAGRALSGHRDAHVLRQTLGRLGVTLPEQAHGATAPDPETLAKVAKALEAARKDVARWRLRGQGFEVLEPGLVSLYEDGRDAMWFARSGGDEDALHAWRRQVKYLRYSLRPLVPLWPEVCVALDAEWDRLGEILGQENDLAVALRRMKGGLEGVEAATLQQAELEILKRRAGLEAQALALGGRLYAEAPKAFGRRWRRWWEAWIADSTRGT
ncbi:MAG: CHAD domain-containing protein [Alphaproteobacteria bacterium]|nr:CHAD domain-containing protein [Alphaproteobacteria bacterium]MCB9794746.1 CHAD domain-containing protein [Alphaproteobacteria bacterium]